MVEDTTKKKKTLATTADDKFYRLYHFWCLCLIFFIAFYRFSIQPKNREHIKGQENDIQPCCTYNK